MRRAIASIALILTVLIAAPSRADVPPYEAAGTGGTSAEPSSSGTAVVDATADVNGNLSVEAEASENYVLPVALVDGRSEAVAAAGVADFVAVVSAGSMRVVATLQDLTAAAAATGLDLNPLLIGNGTGQIEASMYAILFDCSSGPCSSVSEPGAEGYQRVTLACADSCVAPEESVALEVPIEVPDGVTGHVFVEVAMYATAIARGQSEASASASAVVSSIEVVPAS